MSSPIGAELAWRQLVDLVGRGRVAADDVVIARLRMIRASVPPPVRAASARAVADASPPLSLVMLFAEDEIAVAAPVLRGAQLAPADWAEILPRLSPTGRSILRHRRDLAGEVVAMLASFGSVDFVLASPVAAAFDDGGANDPGLSATSTGCVAANHEVQPKSGVPVGSGGINADGPDQEPYEIAEMLKRIAAYQRSRAAKQFQNDPQTHLPSDAGQQERFHFETDSAGTIRWVEGVSRTTLIGLSLTHASNGKGVSSVDRAVAQAFRERSAFADLGLVVAGQSAAAGTWRISAVPLFDPATGRFDGFRGNALRSNGDAARDVAAPNAVAIADALRQLVHELRTPTNAIAGFAEMIETEMLGPVPEVYRGQATEIRNETANLLGAIEDMDSAARTETAPGQRLGQPLGEGISVTDMLDRIATDLAPLATLRGATIALHGLDEQLTLYGDGRAIERLIARLLSTLVAAAGVREQIGVVVSKATPVRIRLVFDRPAGLASDTDEADGTSDTPSLGTGFALRLTDNLATELGGELAVARHTLTLELPIELSRTTDAVARD